MKQFTRLYNSLGMLAMLCLASCASEELNDRLLPAGKYPMTFTTAMEGLTQTRATTDNTWAGDEKIAVQVGSEVKQYIPTSGKTATLTGADADNTFYWQKAEETISAWYCGDGSTAAKQQYAKQLPTTWTVKTDQSGGDYVKSDLLYAMPQKIEYKDRNKQLTFKHLPAKVVINLQKGKGLTEENIQNATVSIFCQAITSGEINKGTGIMEQAVTGSGSTAITPNVLAVPESGFQKSVQAIVVPQKIAVKTKFIKVTIGTGGAARDYYYTPKAEEDANLECGRKYTFNIMVTKGEELVVTSQTTVTWEDGTASSSPVTEATTFNVICPNSEGVNNLEISNTTTTPSGDKYTVNANAITISYKTNLKRYRYNLVRGFAKISTSTSTDGTITLTVSDIRGDLVFSFEQYPEVGDYYYADGTWSPDYKTGSDSPACIGIVFKVGAGEGDAASYYGNKLPNGIRGYVVALTDAVEEICTWGQRGINTPLDNVTSKDNADYNGFQNTKTIIKQYGETGGWQHYDAFQAIIDYRDAVVAPQSSSDWYLPSLKQLADIYSLYQNRAGHILYDRLQSTSSDHLFKEVFEGTYEPGGYWTSTERHESDAWYVRFTDGARTAFSKGQSYARNCYVRAILTF